MIVRPVRVWDFVFSQLFDIPRPSRPFWIVFNFHRCDSRFISYRNIVGIQVTCGLVWCECFAQLSPSILDLVDNIAGLRHCGNRGDGRDGSRPFFLWADPILGRWTPAPPCKPWQLVLGLGGPGGLSGSDGLAVQIDQEVGNVMTEQIPIAKRSITWVQDT